jgi:beta-mannosidase
MMRFSPISFPAAGNSPIRRRTKSGRLALGALFAAGLIVSARAQVQTVDLGGDWQLSQGDTANDTIPAKVPGNVHLDLQAAYKIPDPFFGDNDKKLEWVYKSDWTYHRAFNIAPDLLHADKVLLRCEGLDTVADIKINGQELGKTDNMFRTWEFDVKSLLQAGNNTIDITFGTADDYIRAFNDRAPKIPGATSMGVSSLRKAGYAHGWDFCASYMTCGIYKPIEIVAFNTARLKNIAVTQHLDDPTKALLDVAVDADVVNTPALAAVATVSLDGKQLATVTQPWAADKNLELSIDNPQLWWPNGMGAQPLYTVAVDLKSSTGQVLGHVERRIGLRTVKLLLPSDGLPLRLEVNGKPLFSKGIDWVPADVFPARVTPEKLKRYVDDAVDVGVNTIRMWGGGYYEGDAFYDRADERGLLVWNEFDFACAAYPGANPEFQDNVRAEIKDQVARLRNHPCIAVWCGNNEVINLVTGYKLLTKEQYDAFFHTLIGGLMKDIIPDANYVGGSPEAGDDHYWWVWHVGADFEKYRESHGWVTEFGFQSFPVPATVDSYTSPDDRSSVLSPINVNHQHNGNGKGNPMILDKVNRNFRAPKDFDSTLWLSQINQAYGLEIGIEHWRADWPKSSGCALWQYDDCYPGPSWSTVDYYGRWKAMHYRFLEDYAPVMITGDVDKESGDVLVHVASDLLKAADGNLTWTLTNTDGNTLNSGTAVVPLPEGTASTEGPKLELGSDVHQTGPEHCILWLKVTADGHDYTKMILFGLPKILDLSDPQLDTSVTQTRSGFDVSVSASHPALFAWINCSDPDARYSNNFFHLAPSQSAVVHVTPSKPISLADFKSSLTAQSLYDTYSH